MKVLALALAVGLASCGPAPTLLASYHGELIDHEGQPHDCILEIAPTAPDRVHIHLDYGAGMCDGDGATVHGDLLLPDAGGEIFFDTYTLRGNFFSATGREYRIDVAVIESPEGAQYVSPGRSPGSRRPAPNSSPERAK